MNNFLASHLLPLLNYRLCRGVSPPARIACAALLSVPLNSHGTIPQGGGFDLIPANTPIPTQLPAPVSPAISLYNTHSKR
jgi:hypothetical protein